MSPHSNSSQSRIASQVVASAIAYLSQRFPGESVQCVSAGVLGSYARSDLCATSDLDFYLIFDLDAFASIRMPMTEESMSQIVCELSDHVLARHPQEPLAQRFSVFWSTLDSLETGRLDVGRFPAYDRQALSSEGEHVWGKPVSKPNLAKLSHFVLVNEAARFFLGVVREKVGTALLERVDHLEGAELERLGPVLLSKAATMPARLLYTLESRDEGSRVVSTEEAAREMRSRCHGESWWPLVETGLKWRKTPPKLASEWSDAAGLLRQCLQGLYVYCASAYVKELERIGSVDLALQVQGWQEQLRSA